MVVTVSEIRPVAHLSFILGVLRKLEDVHVSRPNLLGEADHGLSFLVAEASKYRAVSLFCMRRSPPHGVRAWAIIARAASAHVLPCLILERHRRRNREKGRREAERHSLGVYRTARKRTGECPRQPLAPVQELLPDRLTGVMAKTESTVEKVFLPPHPHQHFSSAWTYCGLTRELMTYHSPCHADACFRRRVT